MTSARTVRSARRLVTLLGAALIATAAVVAPIGPASATTPTAKCQRSYLTVHTSTDPERDYPLVNCHGNLLHLQLQVVPSTLIAFRSDLHGYTPKAASVSGYAEITWSGVVRAESDVLIKAGSTQYAEIFLKHAYPCTSSACGVVRLKIVPLHGEPIS